MKKTGILLIMGAVLALAAPAMADTITLVGGSGFGPYTAGSGGEFTFQVNSGPPGPTLDLSGYNSTDVTKGITADIAGINSFQTFCIEDNEFIDAYQTYSVAISNEAILGGVGGPHPDPISVGTGWLYSQFAQGTLAGYDYTNPGRSGTDTSSAALLQNTIWFLEEEIPSIADNVFVDALITQFGSLDNAALDTYAGQSAASFGVAALNLSGGPCTDGPANCQDQLYYSKSITETSVPDGGTTLLLLGIALCGMAIVSRRFRRA